MPNTRRRNEFGGGECADCRGEKPDRLSGEEIEREAGEIYGECGEQEFHEIQSRLHCMVRLGRDRYAVVCGVCVVVLREGVRAGYGEKAAVRRTASVHADRRGAIQKGESLHSPRTRSAADGRRGLFLFKGEGENPVMSGLWFRRIRNTWLRSKAIRPVRTG